LAAWAGVVDRIGRRRLAALLAALLALTLALAPRAEAYVYWGETARSGGAPDGTIGRANPDGTRVDQDFIPTSGCDVAVGPSHIYWTAGGERAGSEEMAKIGRAQLDGGGANQSFIENAGFAPYALAVDASHLYWINGPVLGGTGSIARANLDGTDADLHFMRVDQANGLAVDAAHVYWSDVRSRPPTIARANLDGTGVEPDFVTNAGPGRLAVSDKHIYWGGVSIGRANLDGTGVDRRFIAAAGAYEVAVDAAHIYWTNYYDGTIGRANLDGTGVDRSFITGLRYPCGVAVDALPGFGKVKRNKKRGTARLTVAVPGPGQLKLASTRKVKGAEKRVEAEGREKLPVTPKGKAKKQLNRRGKAKVKAKLTYAPDGGEPNMQSKQVKLIKRR
jgi:hypothetical protein